MADQNQVGKLHHEHPGWAATQSAARLGCMPEYVRATGRRCGLTFAKTRAERQIKPESLIALGMAAREAGLSVADIQSLSRGRAARSARVAHNHEVVGSNPTPATSSRGGVESRHAKPEICSVEFRGQKSSEALLGSRASAAEATALLSRAGSAPGPREANPKVHP